ncbi:hypothetical protein [Plasticicumulans sp.]|uniref:hypothetical protein n=1 Tax=Plasticicumulans sp. TaxID=2307179 RepID=UPI002BCD6E67|nr:hypothetical protein [Plasticicumulans sp.]
MATKTPHEWSSEALLTKAERYAELMLEQDRDEWQFGFWSALCLEMILRGAVAKVSPVLLADGKDWNNTLFALGAKGLTRKLSPKSIDATEVISRLEVLVTGFNREIANFCALHLQRRNAELHSGSLPFDSLSTSTWLPQFYVACNLLLSTQGSSIEDIFGSEEVKTAETLIEAVKDEAAKSVKGTISAHKTIWEDKPLEEQEKLIKQAETVSLRVYGHRVKCPACGSTALLHGSPAGAESSTYKDGLIVVRQPMLPANFECKACGLKIVGYSKLNACGLGGIFTSTSPIDPIEYFEDDFRDRYSGMDDDNNEP